MLFGLNWLHRRHASFKDCIAKKKVNTEADLIKMIKTGFVCGNYKWRGIKTEINEHKSLSLFGTREPHRNKAVYMKSMLDLITNYDKTAKLKMQSVCEELEKYMKREIFIPYLMTLYDQIDTDPKSVSKWRQWLNRYSIRIPFVARSKMRIFLDVLHVLFDKPQERSKVYFYIVTTKGNEYAPNKKNRYLNMLSQTNRVKQIYETFQEQDDEHNENSTVFERAMQLKKNINKKRLEYFFSVNGLREFKNLQNSREKQARLYNIKVLLSKIPNTNATKKNYYYTKMENLDVNAYYKHMGGQNKEMYKMQNKEIPNDLHL